MKFSKSLLFCFACCFVIFASSLQAETATLSTIYVSIGPDPYSSPNYSGYTTNAQAGVTAGGVNVGGNINASPSAYNVVGTGAVAQGQIIATPFSSWLNVADPGGVFSGETGNFLYWSIVITGAPGQNDINLNSVSVVQSSTDPLMTFGDPASPSVALYSTSTYAPDAVGILANGSTITSGSPTQDVNEIVLTGFGAALDPTLLPNTFTGTDAQQLQQIDAAFAADLGNFSINTCFDYTQTSGTVTSSCDTVNVSATPEVSTVRSTAFAGLALIVFWFYRRQRA